MGNTFVLAIWVSHISLLSIASKLTCDREGLSPYADVMVDDLHMKQRYDVSLHLKVPALESNFELGNFMTSLTFTTLSNVTLGTVRRPVSSVIVCGYQTLIIWQRPSLFRPNPGYPSESPVL